MAKHRARKDDPLEIVSVDLLLGRDATVYVRSATAEEISPTDLTRAATVMCIEWAVRSTLSDSGWTSEQVDRHLTLICASSSAHDYNARVNADTVVLAAPPAGAVTTHLRGTLTVAGEGLFETRWRMPRSCDEPHEAARVLAVLWNLAEQAGNGAVVQHALYALRGGYAGTGQFTPAVHSTLATSLVNFGVEMARADLRADEARARMRAV